MRTQPNRWLISALAVAVLASCSGKISLPGILGGSGGGSSQGGSGGSSQGGGSSAGGGSSSAGGGSGTSGGGSGATGGGTGATGGGSGATGGGAGASGGGSAAGGGSGTGGGGGGGVFTADSPAVYGAKVKNVLTGLALTDTELQTLNADPTQLNTLVGQWMALPQYDQKMLRFFELSFQQTQVSSGDFGNQLDLGQLQVSSNLMLQNLQESFARTAVAMADSNAPFNTTMSTTTYQMTTATQVFYALLDVWQMDNSLTGLHDYFKNANPTLTITVTGTGTPIPLSQTLDPLSSNYMHWYDPRIATVCGSDPHTMSARGNNMYYLLLGKYIGCNSGGGTGTPQLTAADFSDWKPVTIRAPITGEKPTAFYDLNTLRDPAQKELVLNRAFVGFFSTPAFAANWQTNDSNQMRVTVNQSLIVATNTQVDGTDPTVPTSTPGLDAAHANNAGCLYCHQTLDPTRSILAATWSWNYGNQLATAYSNQPGLFAYRGVQANVTSIQDFGDTLSTHPLFAPGWVQKLCYYVNSEPCDQTDPEFTRIVTNFSSGYSWNALVKDLVTSPITTHASSTTTVQNNGAAVAVARRDHLCAQWNARLQLPDVCGLDVTKGSPLQTTAKQIIGGLPSDGYSRGSTAPVLPNDPSLFYRAGIENLCGALAVLLIDNNSAPAGAKTWSSSAPTPAISDFATLVAGLPPSDPRSAQLQTLLTSHFNSAKATSGTTATAALQSTFMAACMAPSASAIGM